MVVFIQNYSAYDVEQMDADDDKAFKDGLTSPAVGLSRLSSQEPEVPKLSLPDWPRSVDRLTGNRSAFRSKGSIKTTGSDVRVAQLEGRDHYVVPMVLIAGDKNGMVMHGSNGPVHYPLAETTKTAHLWNGRPIVKDHPNLHGISSANDPQAYNRQRVGTVFNARVDNGQLKAEAWIDIQRANAVDRRIVEAITKRQVLEVSTGVYVDRAEGTGVVNGRAYQGVALNYRPDHLAILLDAVGACSVKDGCGLLRNSTSVPSRLPDVNRVPTLSLPG